MRPASLRARLTLLALLTTACWMILLAVGFNLFLGARLRAEADDLLRTRAEAVAATVQTSPGGTLTVRESRDDQVLDTDTWIYHGDHAVERPQAAAVVQEHADALAGTGERFSQLAEPLAIRFYALPILDRGHPVGTTVVAVALDPYQRMARLALVGSVGLTLFILLGISIVTGAVIRRALEPVTRMSTQAAEWSEHEIGQRFGTAERPTELAALAANLDALLDRLAAVVRHERQLSGELSHELRTPLAQIGAETELLLARPRSATEQRAAHTAIAAGVARMREIIETLLTTARMDIAEVPGRCDIAALLARLAGAASPEGPTIRVRSPARCVAGVPKEIVERILTPILDNARRYAATQITIAAENHDRAVRIAVGDDGPGVPADLTATLFEPGRRGDPHDGHDGAGLGLALARRLAHAAGGDVVLAETTAGATFEVLLPYG
ncbi:HAMP domain-containing sensor histidine kinase [Actinoallomurus vinaceus]|uniref:sensor histidine kinase n=1 Tax=Actinoallomurus vinaceus TaxID=1080074 RepID=UPI0031ECC3E6